MCMAFDGLPFHAIKIYGSSWIKYALILWRSNLLQVKRHPINSTIMFLTKTEQRMDREKITHDREGKHKSAMTKKKHEPTNEWKSY